MVPAPTPHCFLCGLSVTLNDVISCSCRYSCPHKLEATTTLPSLSRLCQSFCHRDKQSDSSRILIKGRLGWGDGLSLLLRED